MELKKFLDWKFGSGCNEKNEVTLKLRKNIPSSYAKKWGETKFQLLDGVSLKWVKNRRRRKRRKKGKEKASENNA